MGCNLRDWVPRPGSRIRWHRAARDVMFVFRSGNTIATPLPDLITDPERRNDHIRETDHQECLKQDSFLLPASLTCMILQTFCRLLNSETRIDLHEKRRGLCRRSSFTTMTTQIIVALVQIHKKKSKGFKHAFNVLLSHSFSIVLTQERGCSKAAFIRLLPQSIACLPCLLYTPQ